MKTINKTLILCVLSLSAVTAFASVQENKCEAYYDAGKDIIVLTNDIQGIGSVVEENCLEVAKKPPVAIGGNPVVKSIEIKYFYN